LTKTDEVQFRNTEIKSNILESIRDSVNKNRPFGKSGWIVDVVNKFGLEISLRQPGRPKRSV